MTNPKMVMRNPSVIVLHPNVFYHILITLNPHGHATKSHFCIDEMYFGLGFCWIEIDKLLDHHVQLLLLVGIERVIGEQTHFTKL
jgi:hypothetical protein